MARPTCFAALLAAALGGSASAQTFSTLRSYWSAAQLDNQCSASDSLYSLPTAGYGWYRNEGIVFTPSALAPTGHVGLKRLERWYSPSRGDFFTTTHSGWQGAAGQTRSPDYTWNSHEGWLFPSPVAGTSDLREYFSSARNDNFITSDTRYTTYDSIPGYITVGSQGYIINDPYGQTDLIPKFNFGEMYVGGGAAVGIHRLQLILISYTDSPMRHTAAQYQSLFFGSSFPNVNNAFWNNTMGSWLWSNPGIRGPLTLANDPDTTGDESKWRDVWDPTYAPFLFLGLRTNSAAHFVASPGGPGSTTGAASTGFGPWETFGLNDINGGNLISGDTVAFKTMNSTWLRVSGTNVLGDGASSATSDCRFLIFKVSGSAGTQIINGDVVRLRSSSTSNYLHALGGGGGALACDTPSVSLTAENLFTPLKTATSNIVQGRAAIQAAIAAGMNLASFDDDGNGIVTDEEMQLFLIGASPTTAAGAGTRGLGAYTPPGSATSVNLNAVVGAGEDLSFATIIHELSHCIGAGYELYGAASINQNMAIMGATIYSNADDRQTYLHDPWTRMRFGWLHPRIFSMSDAGASTLLEVSDAYPETINKRPVLIVDPLHFNFSTGEGEYFMLEYRNPNLSATSYDTNCAGQGLYIWHCKTGPGGTNLVIPSTHGACCNGAVCSFQQQPTCPSGWTFKGQGTTCAAGSLCPAGSPPPSTAIDGSINLQGPFTPSGGALQYLRGTSNPWTLTNQPSGGIIPKYLDGSDAAVRIRLGTPTTDGRSLPVEWSYSGSLPERIDSLDRYRFRRMSTQTMRGMFGTRATNLNVHTTGGTFVGELGFAAQTPTQISGVYAPTTFPTGTYYLTCQVGAFPGNQVQITITPRSDWNEDGILSVLDIFDFLNDWFAGTGDYAYPWGSSSVDEIFQFLSDWFAGI